MTDFTWSKAAGRYRDATTGRWVTDHQVKAGVEAMIEQSSERLARMGTEYRAGNMTLEAFRTGLFDEIKSVHIAAGLAGYGGRQAMDPSRWGFLGHEIRGQYGYARKFVGQILDGTQPDNGRLDARARLYAQHARTTFEAVRLRERQEAGAALYRNVLHASESCEQCVQQSDMGFVPIGGLLPIGERQCLANCRCTYEFRRVQG